MQIAFWSTRSGQTGTTSSLIAMACEIALNYRLKILIAHNQFNNSSMETAFLDRNYVSNSHYQYQDIGIDALVRTRKLNSLDDENITRYTTSLLKGRLDLLVGTKNLNEELYLSDFGNTFYNIIKSIDKYYDLVFIDVMAGEHPFAKQVLEQSDIIAVNLNQNIGLLDVFFKKDYPKLKEKCFLMLGRYDLISKYCIKNIKRQYKIQDAMGVIPYNRGFADAMNEGRCIDFYLKNLNSQKGDPYYYFIHEVSNSVVGLLTYMNIDIKAKKKGE